MRARLALIAITLVGGCAITDVGTVCFVVPAEAGGRLEVTSILVSGDRGPHDFECHVDGEPNTLTVGTTARSTYDPTPFTSLDIAIESTAACTSAALIAGPGSVTFAGKTLDFVVPGDGATVTCFDGVDRTPLAQDTDVASDTGEERDTNLGSDTDQDTDRADSDSDSDLGDSDQDTDAIDTDVDTDAVDTDVAPFCGDGRITGNEECDDIYDFIPWDGCTGCVVDAYWYCYGEPSYCVVL
jgi:cysteine-rich repeat protein